jgi:acylphosphatase
VIANGRATQARAEGNEMIRATTIFRGRVQGVGFRATTRQCARAHPVTGFVRNEPDGTVLCVIEGRAEDVDALLDDIQHAMRCSIAAVDTTHGPATGEFEGFTIRR